MKTHASLLKFILITFFTIPSVLFGQQSDFPYNLKKSDFIIGGVGLSTKLYANYRENKQELMSYRELISLDKSEINGFDRGAVYNWNPDLNSLSEWTRAAVIVPPVILLLNEGLKNEWGNTATYGTMYIEVALLTMGITDLTKTLAQRKRPYLYNPHIRLAEKEKMIESNVYDSFLSGHTSSAFAAAVFFSKTYSDIYGNTTLSKVIWGTSLALASTTGYLRYQSGQHYPSDIIAGAFVGSAIGYLIPVLHKNVSKTKNLSYQITGHSLSLSYNF